MENKNSKLIVFAISLALLIGSVFAVSAFADDAAASPDILSYNIAYQGDFALMVAVAEDSVAEGAVDLDVWLTEPDDTPDRSFTAPAPEIIEIEGVEHSAYVMTTVGIGAKDMGDIIYLQVTDAEGNKSAIIEYSVAHYFLERLYGGAEITAKQKAIYESALAFGANVQSLLAPTDTPVTSLCYVAVENVDGYSVVAKGETVDLEFEGTAPQSGWLATYPDGSTKNISGTSITVDGHMTLSPLFLDVIDFEDAAIGDKGATNDSAAIKFYDHNSNLSETGIVADPTDPENKVFRVNDTSNSNFHVRLLFGDTMKSSENTAGNTYVFSTKLYVASPSSDTTNNSAFVTFDLRTSGAATGYNVSIVYLGTDDGEWKLGLKSEQRLDANMDPVLGDGADDGGFYTFYKGDALPCDTWLDFEIVMTHYDVDGTTFVDVSFRVGGVEIARQDGISKFSKTNIKVDADSANFKFIGDVSSLVYFDDVYLERR